MINFFSSNCPTQGQWTQTAINYAENLVSTLKAIQNDPDCKSLSGSLTQLQSLSSVVSRIGQDPDQKLLMSLKKQQEEALLLLSQTTDPAQTASLTTQLQTLNLKLAEARGNTLFNGDSNRTAGEAQALSQLVSGTNILLQQAAQNSTCIEKTPGVLPAIAGLTGSVQAALMTSGYSMVVAAGADLLNGVIEGIRKTRIAKKINRMSSAITASAYQCVMESLSNQWCASEDALQVVRLKGRSIVSTTVQTPLEKGIDLLNTDSKMFLDWLETLRAGTDPANQATASRQADVLDRDKQVRVARLTGLGVISENLPIFKNTAGDEAQWRVEQQVIITIVESFINSGGQGHSSPLSDVFGANAREQAQWYLIGIPDSQIPRDPNTGGRKALSSFAWKDIPSIVGDPTFKPSLSFVQGNMLQWVTLAKERVNTELSLILNLDPLKLMVNAATPGLNHRSPYRSLVVLNEFMKAQTLPGATFGSFKGIYADTVTRLSVIEEQIKKVLQGQKADGDPFLAAAAITEIYKAAVLDNGTGFLGERIRWAIRLSLNALVTSGQSGISQQQAAALLASNDIVKELQAISPDADLNLMARDIQNSQVVLESTLQAFVSEFGKGIRKSLEDYRRQAAQQGQSNQGTSLQALSEMCLKLLAVPTWPGNVPEELCWNASLSSVFPEGPSSTVVTSDLIRASFPSRVCSYRDFKRKNRMYQFYRENLLDGSHASGSEKAPLRLKNLSD